MPGFRGLNTSDEESSEDEAEPPEQEQPAAPPAEAEMTEPDQQEEAQPQQQQPEVMQAEQAEEQEAEPEQSPPPPSPPPPQQPAPEELEEQERREEQEQQGGQEVQQQAAPASGPVVRTRRSGPASTHELVGRPLIGRHDGFDPPSYLLGVCVEVREGDWNLDVEPRIRFQDGKSFWQARRWSRPREGVEWPEWPEGITFPLALSQRVPAPRPFRPCAPHRRPPLDATLDPYVTLVRSAVQKGEGEQFADDESEEGTMQLATQQPHQPQRKRQRRQKPHGPSPGPKRQIKGGKRGALAVRQWQARRRAS